MHKTTIMNINASTGRVPDAADVEICLSIVKYASLFSISPKAYP